MKARGCESIVPNTGKGLVEFPPSFQKLDEARPPSVSALTLLMPAPFPLKLPPKLFALLLNVTVFEYVPARLRFGTTPVTLAAVIAYGVEVNLWRGFKVVKARLPLLRTPISSHRSAPGKMPGPKSSTTVKSPLLTA